MKQEFLDIVRPVDDGLPGRVYRATTLGGTPRAVTAADIPSQEVTTKVENVPKTTATESTTVDATPDVSVEVPDDYQALPSAYKGLEEANKALQKYNFSASGKRAILAQLGLESAWGTHDNSGIFNYGNITAGSTWKGKTTQGGDKDAEGNKITQTWRVYNSAQEHIDDYVGLIKRMYPIAYSELSNDNFDIDRFSGGLVDGKYKYAEHKDYKNILKNTYNGVNKRYPVTRRQGGILYRTQ